MKNIRKILFISLSNLGDIVLTTPVFDKLRVAFPDAVIDVVTGSAGESIFAPSPAVRKVIVRKRRQNVEERVSELMDLRKEKYDLAVDLKNSFLPFVSGARYKFPFFPVWGRRGHMRDVHLGVIRKLVSSVFENTRFFIPVSKEDRDFVSGVMGGMAGTKTAAGKVVTVNPGAKSHLKRWGENRYAELVFRLKKELGCRVFMVGGSEDIGAATAIMDISEGAATDLTGKTSVGALYEIIKRSDLFITNDSGPLHLASAAATPTVAVFGPSNEKKYGPLSAGSIVLCPEVDCRPCEKAQCSKGLKDGCISRVTAERVFEAAKKVLGK